MGLRGTSDHRSRFRVLITTILRMLDDGWMRTSVDQGNSHYSPRSGDSIPTTIPTNPPQSTNHTTTTSTSPPHSTHTSTHTHTKPPTKKKYTIYDLR